MKVVVIGGTGVFGARLVRLLLRDGHDVTVAGRDGVAAAAFAAEVGAGALGLDRAGDLAPLWALGPDVVVDAAGPFHAYGADPYRLPREAIAAGVSYLDLADDADFCAGIAGLDAAAKDAGVFALSGVSSVPAISSAAVAMLAEGADEIDVIDTAILPGNRAPRGRSVVESILHQCGAPLAYPLDGAEVTGRGWSDPASYDLGQGLRRKGWMIRVPDQALFADAFGARTVIFRAGLELPLMNRALAVVSWFRSKAAFRWRNWMVGGLVRLADLLKPFGSDVGGMSVSVTGRWGASWERRTWRLIAEAGEGPFIPAVAARAVLRRPGAIAPGARPAVAVVPMLEIAAAMADLAVKTEVVAEDSKPIFPAVLGDAFDSLPPEVQTAHRTHGPRLWQGRGSVTRGASRWARFVAWLFRFPQATDDIAVSVTMTPKNGGELWERRFGDATFRSFLRPENGRMTERFGPLTFTLGLHVAEGRLHYPVVLGRCGPIPLPRFLLPQSVASEYAADGRFHFDVALLAPFTGAPMVHYRGWLTRASGFGDRDKKGIQGPEVTASVKDRVL